MNELYQCAANWISNLNIKKALDLYCGVGGFTFSLAPFVEEIIGIEISAQAIASANKTLANGKNKNISFQVCDLENSTQYLNNQIDLVLINPPRRGIDQKLVTNILDKKPKYLLYSSCNAETLEKNLAQLKVSYEIVQMHPFDMFAYSEHWEILTLLKRLDFDE